MMTRPDLARATGRRLAPLVALALLLAGSPGAAADLPVLVVFLSSPVAPFGDATLQIQTASGAACTIDVIYKSGPSRAKGLIPQVADARGWITWRWVVGSNTTRGRWPILVTCERGRDLGRLETSFEVR